MNEYNNSLTETEQTNGYRGKRSGEKGQDKRR